MAEVVRTIRKRGARNREINDSVKEAMRLILENRKMDEEQKPKSPVKEEAVPIPSNDIPQYGQQNS